MYVNTEFLVMPSQLIGKTKFQIVIVIFEVGAKGETRTLTGCPTGT